MYMHTHLDRPAPAPPLSTLRLSEVLAALTRAIDMTEGQVPGHAARTCYISMRIAEALDLDEAARSDVFYTALVKDAGCSSNAARVCQIFGIDDLAVKRAYDKIETGSMLGVAKFVIGNAGAHDPWAQRLARIARLAVNGPAEQRELEMARCEQGSRIALKLGFGQLVADSVHAAGEFWNGKGPPLGLRGEQIPLPARIVAVAQAMDLFGYDDPKAALRVARARRGKAFDPDIVDAFLGLIEREGERFWTTLHQEDTSRLIADHEPADRVLEMDEERLDDVTTAFAEVIDAKSPYTGSHSFNVALYAEAMALRLGLDEQLARTVRRAALLHDLGKLGISNRILDKPGRLNDHEMAAMRDHPRHTHEIVARVPALAGIGELAACHHERLDGSGYHRGLRDEQIPLAARVIAVADVWEALRADRPYRPSLPPEQAFAVMDGMVGHHLGREAYQALREVV